MIISLNVLYTNKDVYVVSIDRSILLLRICLWIGSQEVSCTFRIERGWKSAIVSLYIRMPALVVSVCSVLFNHAPTSRVVMKESRDSFTKRNWSGSVSLSKLCSIAWVRRPITDVHNSSTSRSLRKLRAVLRTSLSMMKNPVISCSRDVSAGRFKGKGRIRSDWACKMAVSLMMYLSAKLFLTFLSAW